LRELHGGRDYDAAFGARMSGRGIWAQLLAQRFQRACARLGLNRERLALDVSQFRPGLAVGQGSLF
ncbi:MAG: radical SAM protein, partial [Hylemonella sp.]